MSGSNPNDDTVRRLTREFLRRKHDQAFEFARELAASGDETRIGDLGRVHLETIAEYDRLRAELVEVREKLANALRPCDVCGKVGGDCCERGPTKDDILNEIRALLTPPTESPKETP